MTEEEKRMYDSHKEHGEDMSYENEAPLAVVYQNDIFHQFDNLSVRDLLAEQG